MFLPNSLGPLDFFIFFLGGSISFFWYAMQVGADALTFARWFYLCYAGWGGRADSLG